MLSELFLRNPEILYREFPENFATFYDFPKSRWGPLGGSGEVPRALEVNRCDTILRKDHIKTIFGGIFFSTIFGPQIFRDQIVIFRKIR